MQFHDLAETLLGSRVKIKVLRTLWKYEEKEFTIRELAKFLGISHTGIKKVLDELEKTNVVKVRTLGKSHAFRLNVGSYAAGIVKGVFDMEGKVLSELREMLKKRLESPWVTSAALFGSIAEERETPRSDIDLFIVTEHREKVEEMVAGLQKDVSERFGNSISVYYVSEEDLGKKRRGSPVKQVLQSHLLICGRPLG
jgi:predicted nucleotidyltransferase